MMNDDVKLTALQESLARPVGKKLNDKIPFSSGCYFPWCWRTSGQ